MEDVLLEIFSWLPKKSQLRCGAVCKRWEHLIKECASSSFGASARSIEQYGSIILHESERRRATFSRFDGKGCLVHEHTINLESIVGPLCRYANCRNPLVLYPAEEKPNHHSFHVYDPLTLHHTAIPPIITTSSSSKKTYEVAPFPFCMGYVPCSEDGSRFKLVVATYQVEVYMLPPKIQFSVFDSETGVWETEQPKKKGTSGSRQKSDGRNLPGIVDFMDVCPPCLSLHGDLFWLRVSCIFVFKMKTWTVRRIELPHSPTEHRGCFWESDGRLKYCQILPTHIGFCIWVLEEPLEAVNDPGNYKWRKIFSVSQDTLNSLLIQAGREPYPAHHTRVSAFDEDHGIIHLQTPDPGLLSYDISEKRFTPIAASSSSSKWGFWGHQPFISHRLNTPGIASRKRKAESEDAVDSDVKKFCKH